MTSVETSESVASSSSPEKDVPGGIPEASQHALALLDVLNKRGEGVGERASFPTGAVSNSGVAQRSSTRAKTTEGIGKGIKTCSPDTACHTAFSSMDDDATNLGTGTCDEVEVLRKELAVQEKILAALQKDNACLLREKKAAEARSKELESQLANLEAKHSLLQSANEPAAAARSTVDAASHQRSLNELHIAVKELRQLLDDAEKGKEALQSQVNGLQQEKAQWEADEVERQRLRAELREARRGRVTATEETLGKVATHADKGSADDAQGDLIRRQDETIRQLRSQVSELTRVSVKGSAANSGQNGEIEWASQTQQLRSRISELEEALRAKNPCNVAELIRSCQPSAKDARTFQRMEGRIRQQEEALAAKDSFTEAAIERLRKESEKMRLRYEETIASLQTKLATCAETAAVQRVQELENELLFLRRDVGNGRTRGNAAELARSPDADEGALVKLQDLLKENCALKSRLAAFESGAVETNGSSHVSESLKAQAQILREELELYKKTHEEQKAHLHDVRVHWEQRLSQAKHDFTVQIQTLREQHNSELNRLEKQHQEDLLCAVKQENSRPASESVAASLVQIANENGRDAFLRAVFERLCYLEERYIQRDKEAAYELSEAKRVADFELNLQRRKTELLLEEKNQQVYELRACLDRLLAEAAQLHRGSNEMS